VEKKVAAAKKAVAAKRKIAETRLHSPTSNAAAVELFCPSS
jgi:hypothetical protein